MREERRERMRKAGMVMLADVAVVVAAAGFSAVEQDLWAALAAVLAVAVIVYAVNELVKAVDGVANDPEWVLIVNGPGDHMVALQVYEQLAKEGKLPVRLELPSKINKWYGVWEDAAIRCDATILAMSKQPEEPLLFVAGAASDAGRHVGFAGPWLPSDEGGFLLVAREEYRKRR